MASQAPERLVSPQQVGCAAFSQFLLSSQDRPFAPLGCLSVAQPFHWADCSVHAPSMAHAHDDVTWRHDVTVCHGVWNTLVLPPAAMVSSPHVWPGKASEPDLL